MQNIDYKKIAHLIDNTLEFGEQEGAKDYLKTFFQKSYKKLNSFKKDKPEYFDQFDSQELLDYLSTIKKNNKGLDLDKIGDVDLFIVTSGKLITIVENYLTMIKIQQESDIFIYDPKIWVTQIAPSYPTQAQIQKCETFLGEHVLNDFDDLDNESLVDCEKYAECLWNSSTYFKKGSVEFIPFMPIHEYCTMLYRMISSELPDRPLNIVVITPTVDKTESEIGAYFKNQNSPHKLTFQCADEEKEFKKLKMEYYDESLGHTVAYLLNDILHSV